MEKGGRGDKGRVEGTRGNRMFEMGEGTKRESKERDILIKGAITGLERNLALGKCPRIHKEAPS